MGNQRYPSNELLSVELGNYFQRMHFDAACAVQALQQYQRSSVRHNVAVERTALFHSVLVGATCEELLSPDGLYDLEELETATTAEPEQHFDLRAPISLLPNVLPYDGGDRQRLFLPVERSAEAWVRRSEGQECGLIDRWHTWLWSESRVPSNEAKLTLVACSRLTQALPHFLGWNKDS